MKFFGVPHLDEVNSSPLGGTNPKYEAPNTKQYQIGYLLFANCEKQTAIMISTCPQCLCVISIKWFKVNHAINYHLHINCYAWQAGIPISNLFYVMYPALYSLRSEKDLFRALL